MKGIAKMSGIPLGNLLIPSTVNYNIIMQGGVYICVVCVGGCLSVFTIPVTVIITYHLSLGEIVLYNIFYEIFTACTSIIGQAENGKLLHARNLDFGLFMG